jgi:hypothetical protein
MLALGCAREEKVWMTQETCGAWACSPGDSRNPSMDITGEAHKIGGFDASVSRAPVHEHWRLQHDPDPRCVSFLSAPWK